MTLARSIMLLLVCGLALAAQPMVLTAVCGQTPSCCCAQPATDNCPACPKAPPQDQQCSRVVSAPVLFLSTAESAISRPVTAGPQLQQAARPPSRTDVPLLPPPKSL